MGGGGSAGVFGARGSAGVFAAGVGRGGGLVSFRICEGFVLRSTSHLRFSVTCDAT